MRYFILMLVVIRSFPRGCVLVEDDRTWQALCHLDEATADSQHLGAGHPAIEPIRLLVFAIES